MCRVFELLFFLLGVSFLGYSQETHPILILTKEGVHSIVSNPSKPPVYESSYRKALEFVDENFKLGIQVPVPMDMAGGYSHEQHKRNYQVMQQAGILYQISGEPRYAEYIREMLFRYAEMYPGLPLHPANKSYAPGKLFWQCLNDANWLVNAAQAYDCIFDFLNQNERNYLEENLFKPFADFLSIENPQFFNRIHNHSTWGNAAVGMIALVMHDEERFERALYGLNRVKKDMQSKDNDGAFIYENGKQVAGFLAQIDHAFSPDGYYTEGPYYQRYAMAPFMLFAMSIHNCKPEINIFEYREKVLLKAVTALLQQTDPSGQFYPINDCQKGMSIHSSSVISALNIAYFISKDRGLLSIANEQKKVGLDQSGFQVAKDLEAGKAVPFDRTSIELRDGAKGDEGALGILRTKNEAREELAIVFKYTAQGLGHGHYDKLSYSVYDGFTEVLQDYGSARWVNIDQKSGGRYLPENNSWAKQSLAHNTLVVNETSHFGGNYDLANQHHSEPVFFDVLDKNWQIACAREENAYNGIRMRRTLIAIEDESISKPMIIDVFCAFSDKPEDYDLPFHYNGQFLEFNKKYRSVDTLVSMGQAHGYQHVYLEGESPLGKGIFKLTWFKDLKFYTLTGLCNEGEEGIFARIGANDPSFNLRKEPFFLHRKRQTINPVFISVIESHGGYSPVTEIPNEPFSAVRDIRLIESNEEHTLFQIDLDKKGVWTISLSNQNHGQNDKHTINKEGQVYSWTGPYSISKENKTIENGN